MTRDQKILAEREQELVDAKANLSRATRENRAFYQEEVERIEARLPTLRQRAERSVTTSKE